MSDIKQITTEKQSISTSILPLLQWWYIPLHIVAVDALILCYFFITGFLLKFLLAFTYTLFLLAMLGKLLHTVSLTHPNLFKMNSSSEIFPSRLILYATDVMVIYGCSASTASRKITEARDHYKKLEHHSMTIREFCEYFSLDYKDTISILKLWQK
jgi:hypothetical protein